MVKYFIGDIGKLERIEFSGGLESYNVGPLKEAVEQIKREHSLSPEAAFKVFAQGAIEGGSIEWKLTFPDKRKTTLKTTHEMSWELGTAPL